MLGDVHPVFSGFEQLDALFGGFYAGQLIELCGDMATGRTTIALQMAAQCLVADGDAQVIFVDCQVSLSDRRLLQIIRRFQGEQPDDKILNRIQVYEIAEYSQFSRLLSHLWWHPTTNRRLLIIDGIGTVLRSHSLEDFHQWQQSIRQVGLTLRRLACRDAHPIILTNQLNGKGEATLGDCWSQFLDHRIMLQWRQGQRILRCANGREIAYEISDQGIK